MYSSDRVIAVDVGTSKLAVAEFSVSRKGVPQLINYGIANLPFSPDKELESSAYVVSALRDVMRERGIRPGPLFMTISGQAVFPRYVKLPAAAAGKLQEIVRYEAEQNVPFAIEEVVWDYQIFRGENVDELSVMLVAVKVENVNRLADCMEAVRMTPEVMDAAPVALYNAVRFNYPGESGCTLLLDIGARSSNLVFVEEGRVFCRSVPVAGNAMTQEIAKEFEIPLDQAEELKKTQGVVALGGTYAEADPTVERISKIIRNVITRLHAEVNRSINFYRSQQGGSPPDRVYLTGGSSAILNLDRFFFEKLQVPVTHFNPFAMVPVSGRIGDEQVAADARLLGEVVGLSLRRALQCPIEINLLPPEIVARRALRRRLPYFAAAAASVVLILLAMWGYSHRLRVTTTSQLAEIDRRITDFETVQGQLTQTLATREAVQDKTDLLSGLVVDRTRWNAMLGAMHDCLLDGMWIVEIRPIMNGEDAITGLDVVARGFNDRLRGFDSGSKNALEIFRDRVMAVPLFTEKTEIVKQPAVPAGAYAREVTLRVVLKNPLGLHYIR